MKNPTFQVLNAKNGEEAEVYLYGNIGRYWPVDTEKIIQKIEILKSDGLKKIVFYVNSNGGEVPQGLLLFNYLIRNSFEVHFIVDGIAASMAALLLMVPGSKVSMARYAKLMLHSVSGCACGTISEIEGYVDAMKSWQTDLIEILAERTAMTKDQVKKKWFDDKDHWISSADALKLNLVDEIVEGKSGIKPANSNNALDLMLHYENQLLNLNSSDMKLTNDFAKVLNLTGQPTEESILEAVRNATQSLEGLRNDVAQKDKEISTLKDKVKEAETAKVKALVDNAITEKKIGEDMRETYTNLAENNFDATKKVLDSMKGVTSIKSQLEKDQEDEAHKGWSFAKYQKDDPAALATLKEKNFEAYSALYEAQFGKKPQA